MIAIEPRVMNIKSPNIKILCAHFVKKSIKRLTWIFPLVNKITSGSFVNTNLPCGDQKSTPVISFKAFV